MNDGLADILELCLAQMEVGASVEECLAIHPEQRAALEAPLRAATQLRTLPHPPLPAPTRAAVETRLLERAAARRAAAVTSATSNGHAPVGWRAWRSLAPSATLAGILRTLGYRGPLAQPWLRLAAATIGVALALALGAGTLAAARAIITVLHPTPYTAPTSTTLPATPFSLDGPIEQIALEGWIVNGKPIGLDSQTVISGTPVAGAIAHVRGDLQPNGALLARAIRVDAPRLPPTIVPVTKAPTAPVSVPTRRYAPPPTVAPQPPQGAVEEDSKDKGSVKDKDKDKPKANDKAKDKPKANDKAKDKPKANDKAKDKPKANDKAKDKDKGKDKGKGKN
jgi:hypothetical protein